MSHPYGGDDTEYEAGYEKGYLDCQSELSFKIKAVLRFYLHSPEYSATKMSEAIGLILDDKVVVSD